MTNMGDTVAKALSNLGEDPAVKLASLGIRGYRGNAGACPVATYLVSVLPSDYRVVVTNSCCVTSIRGTLTHWRTPVPPAIANFIDAFDQGRHPDLIAETIIET